MPVDYRECRECINECITDECIINECVVNECDNEYANECAMSDVEPPGPGAGPGRGKGPHGRPSLTRSLPGTDEPDADVDVDLGKESWVFHAVSPFTKEGLVHGPPRAPPSPDAGPCDACGDGEPVDVLVAEPVGEAVAVVVADDEPAPPGPPPEVPRRASRGDRSTLVAAATSPALLPPSSSITVSASPASLAASSAPGSSASSVKMSAMEEESFRERRRTALLRQCAALLTADENVPRFSREAFRRVFQEKVSDSTPARQDCDKTTVT